MDPNNKIINGAEEPITETINDQEKENQNIAESIVEPEPRISDPIGLNMDTEFVNHVNDAQESED